MGSEEIEPGLSFSSLGVNLCFAAFHQLEDSLRDDDGDGVVDGNVGVREGGGGRLLAKARTRWTELAARLDTEEVGDGDLRHRPWSGCCSSSEPYDASAGSTPVDKSNVKVFPREDGGRGGGLLPSGCE
jgi:hypothetical protein